MISVFLFRWNYDGKDTLSVELKPGRIDRGGSSAWWHLLYRPEMSQANERGHGP